MRLRSPFVYSGEIDQLFRFKSTTLLRTSRNRLAGKTFLVDLSLELLYNEIDSMNS